MYKRQALTLPVRASRRTSVRHTGDNLANHAEDSAPGIGRINPFAIAGANHSSPSVVASAPLVFFPPLARLP